MSIHFKGPFTFGTGIDSINRESFKFCYLGFWKCQADKGIRAIHFTLRMPWQPSESWVSRDEIDLRRSFHLGIRFR